MTTRRLLLDSIRHYWRTHLGVILGSALAALVLTGALMVGDSVKATLRAQAGARVGKIGEALLCGERFVPWSSDAAKRPHVVARKYVPGPNTAGVLLLSGTAARSDGKARANKVQIVGVDDAFWKLSPSANAVPLAANEIALNERLAAQLNMLPGDEVLLRLEKPSAFSKDAPLSGEEEGSVSLRVRVARLVGDADFGRFALASGQVPPFTAFVPLGPLQQKLGIGEKVNLILDNGEGLTHTEVRSILVGAGMDEFGLRVVELPISSGIELRSPRIFLDPKIVEAARANEKAGASDAVKIGNLPRGLDSLTYFVNELRAGDGSDAKANATPYSMVTAIDTGASGFVNPKLADGEIQITRWLADDLGVALGAKVTVKYFVMGERRQLIEKTRTFTVAAPILEMSEPQLNASWMPDFPGLSDKANCRDWKPGFDFDATRMRDKDQDYWTKFRGTPKAFVTLKTGQELWGNRWGNLTSIRYPAGTKREQVERIAAFIDPAALGFRTVNLREQALAATNAPVDFGELFVYFSFFLIAAAAVLTGLLFTFTIEQRAAEAGLLLAVGWPVKKVRRLFLREGFVLALIGSLAGALLAALYTKGVLHALAGVWGGATGGTRFVFAPSAVTMAIGVVSGVLVALIAMWLASRRLFKMEAAVLLNGEWGERASAKSGLFVGAEKTSKHVAKTPWWDPLTLLGRLVEIIVAFEIISLLFSTQARNPVFFFLTGMLLLVVGIMWSHRILRRIATGTGAESIAQLGARNISRRRGRSLATIAVLASGVFMVIAVDSFRKGAPEDSARRDSGTGGFAFIGESSAPIYEDLNSAKGRDAYALDDKLMSGVRVVQMRVRDGDDASCLNLNRAVQPRILGVDFSELRDKPFGLDWPSVKADGAILGVVDANTLQWALQKKLGDVIEYDGERGEKVRVQFAATVDGSILQGVVIIPERDFVKNFPNTAGTRFFLVDCSREKMDAVREHLTRQLGDRGLELTPAVKRLAEFNEVENTYLSIFQVLGGLGMLLGSAGLGIVVARNVFERRREFGLLEAVGFTPQTLRRLVFAEHRWLIIGALGIGAISALTAVWPRLSAQAAHFPWRGILTLLAGMALIGAFCAWLATRIALRRSQLAALRTE
jgi:ABC-type lipoprotein release transport system permease subunit